jgi:hypothetical protein
MNFIQVCIPKQHISHKATSPDFASLANAVDRCQVHRFENFGAGLAAT